MMLMNRSNFGLDSILYMDRETFDTEKALLEILGIEQNILDKLWIYNICRDNRTIVKWAIDYAINIHKINKSFLDGKIRTETIIEILKTFKDANGNDVEEAKDIDERIMLEEVIE